MKLYGIEKRYANGFALRIPELEIESHKITAVLGESGAGKTTLLNIISGMTSGGRVEDTGGVSYLFQTAKLLPNLTAEENIRFVLPKVRCEKTDEMLARVGLKGKEKRFPHELSGGERQRIAIARAFLYPHDTLLMDEPFSSLDLSLKQSLISLVYNLSQESGSTVIFVTHDVHEAALLSHRALVLRDGEIVLDAPVLEPFPRDFFDSLPVEKTLMRALMRSQEE